MPHGDARPPLVHAHRHDFPQIARGLSRPLRNIRYILRSTHDESRGRECRRPPASWRSVTPLALGLVVLSAFSHATWNLLTKQSRHHRAFLWWTGLVGAVLYLPAVAWSGMGWPWPTSAWAGVVLAAVVRAAYFLALTGAYARGDLSQVYPLARGVAPVLVPPAAMLLLGERPSGIGILGVLTVGLGIYVLHLPHFARTAWLAPLRALRTGAARWAMLTGGLTTVYSILDAWNVRQGVPPLFYAWATIPVAALLLAPWAWRPPTACVAEWRAAGRPDRRGRASS